MERTLEKTSHAQLVMRKLVEAHGAFVEHVGSLETRFDEFAPQLEDLHQSMSRVGKDLLNRYSCLELKFSKMHQQKKEQPVCDLNGLALDWTDLQNLTLGQVQAMVA